MFKKLLNLKFGVTAEEEMNFQKKMISSLKNEYINTDAVNKYITDDGYKIKVDDIKFFIKKYKSEGYYINESKTNKYLTFAEIPLLIKD
jgi:hypothetical protein